MFVCQADPERAGGSYREATCAQEESIYRRTTLRLSLEDPDNVNPEREWRYKIPALGGIYCPDVQVRRPLMCLCIVSMCIGGVGVF